MATQKSAPGAPLQPPPVERPYAVVWAVTVAVVFGVALWVLVPWDWLPGGDLAPIDPTGGLPPEQLAHIERYASSKQWWELGQTAVPPLFLLLLGFTGIGARVVRRLPGIEGIWPLRVMLAALAVVGVAWLTRLPFAAGVEHARNVEGFVPTGWALWTRGQLGVLFGMWAVAALGALLIGLSARVMRRWWWAALSVVSGVLVVVGVWVAAQLGTSSSTLPSMPDGPLRVSLLQVADEMGVEVTDIKVVPETPAVQVLNAYVAPVSDGYDVVVFETMINRTSADEIRFVAAHELAHIEYGDGTQSAMLLGLGVAAAVSLVGAAATTRQRRRTDDGTGGAVADPTAVPWLVAVGVIAALGLVPALDAASRAVEARADVAAMETTGDPGGLVTLQRRLAVLYVDDPHPGVWTRLSSGHPSHAERIALARGWRARQQG